MTDSILSPPVQVRDPHGLHKLSVSSGSTLRLIRALTCHADLGRLRQSGPQALTAVQLSVLLLVPLIQQRLREAAQARILSPASNALQMGPIIA
jgi:hypothetical protein